MISEVVSENVAFVVGLVTLIAAILGVGRWVGRAEAARQQEKDNQKRIIALVEAERRRMSRLWAFSACVFVLGASILGWLVFGELNRNSRIERFKEDLRELQGSVASLREEASQLRREDPGDVRVRLPEVESAESPPKGTFTNQDTLSAPDFLSPDETGKGLDAKKDR